MAAAERDARWESVSGHSRMVTRTLGEREVEYLEISLHVYSDRFNEWRRATMSVERSRIEAHDWLYARALDMLVRDVATLEPR